MTLSAEQRAELDTLDPATVRLKLLQGGAGRGASITGFKCQDITSGDIQDWLSEKDKEQRRRDLQTFNYSRWTFYVAVGALIAAIIGIIVTVIHVWSRELEMPLWNEFKSNDATPKDRRLLLMTQPQMFDGTEEHIYDILVGYWNAKSWAFVAADSPATPATGQTLRVFKWAELPDHSDVTLRSQVGLVA
jgi:hypothetical protein